MSKPQRSISSWWSMQYKTWFDWQCPHQYKPYGKKYDSCDNFVASQSYVISSATGRKYYIRRDSSCSTPSIVYMAFWKKKCEKQGAGSTFSWKPRLRNYKSHIKENRTMSVLEMLQHFLLMNVLMKKYLSIFSVRIVVRNGK